MGEEMNTEKIGSPCCYGFWAERVRTFWPGVGFFQGKGWVGVGNSVGSVSDWFDSMERLFPILFFFYYFSDDDWREDRR
jgi:hypothetical protein